MNKLLLSLQTLLLPCLLLLSTQQLQAQQLPQRTDARYATALASATYRAQHGIKGHCSIDIRAGKAGVGWASSNSQPRTCYWNERHRGAYAVVRGRDGWYSTLIF
jgi:hypothetical protein